MSGSRVFRSVTQSIRARELVEGLGPPMTASMALEDAQSAQVEAWEKAGFAYDMVDRVSLVFDHEHVVGWYTEDMFDSDRRAVRDVCQPLYPDEIISAETPAFRLAHLLEDRPRSGRVLFVVDQHSIIGIVSPSIFQAPLFRLCLFSLTLELETSAHRAALINPLESWNALSEGRRAKAKEVLSIRTPRARAPDPASPSVVSLLAATTIADKGTIVTKGRFIPNLPVGKVQSVFVLAGKVRNWCAHTEDAKSARPLGGDAKEVVRFVDDCLGTIDAIETFTARQGAS